MNSKLRIAMLVSGGGTTMAAILNSIRTGFLSQVEPALVIASRNKIGAIEKARIGGVSEKDIVIFRRAAYDSPHAFGDAMLNECARRGVDFIGQYGWLVKTPTNVIEAYPNMIVNQHPGPLDPGRPDFGGIGMYGRRVHCARLFFVWATARPEYRYPKYAYWNHFFTEAVCHRVLPEYDKGALIKRTTIPINPGDTVDSLQARVLPCEHMIQVETLRDFSHGKAEERPRTEPLIRPEDYNILEWAKEIAIKVYPKG